MKKLFPLFAFIFHIALFAAAALFFLYSRFQPVSYLAHSQEESNALLDNPFCGFFHMCGFLLSEEDPETMAVRCRQYLNSNKRQLMLVQINLKNYSDTDLSETALVQLDRILQEIYSARKQAILRFLYDWDGKALETEPSEISQITRHMDQIAPVVNQYAEAVLLIQSTFTGNCGEMTQTHFGTHEHNRYLMTHLAQVTDPSIFLAVRTPSHLRGVTESKMPITPDNAFNGSLNARLGLFNDGLLGSVYDLGTYDDTSNADSTDPADKGTREEEITFQETLCQYVPNGGEAVLANPYNDLENAIADFQRMHISYLNRDHHAEVLKKWTDSTYEGKDCFHGMNGLEYIEAHLGYRYVVTDSTLSYNALKSDTATFSLTIRNTGFAPSYRCFDGTLTLRENNTGILISLPVNLDVRTIKAGSETIFTFPLVVRSLPEGDYELFFGLTDPYTKRSIQFANREITEDQLVPLGSLTVLPTSDGAAWDAFLEVLFSGS